MIRTVGGPVGQLRPAGPTRPDIVAGGAAPGTRSALFAEWALWGKDAHETGYHVLRCSKGPLRALDFAETITRYSPGELDGFPQYTVSWIPDANHEPEYIALGVHEVALAGPEADGRSRRDAVGREIVFVRLFCVRYADLVRYAEQAEHMVGYLSLVQAVDQIQLPPAEVGPVALALPAVPAPIVSRGPVRRLAEQVATLLLTGRQVCILGADDVPVADRLRFIDTVMALLPYGMRAAMSAATWAGSTSQELKLRLFFLGTARVVGRLADGRPRAEDFLVEWGHPEDIHVTEDPALLYQDWLKDVKSLAPALLAEQVSPARFGAADIRRMVGNLPRDKDIATTLDELGASLQIADQPAIRRAIKRLRRYLAGEDAPAKPVDDQLDYQRRIRRARLLVDDERLSAALKADLYDVLLPVAFGPALTYAGYCAVEECAGIPLHTSLRSALARFAAADWLAYFLVHASRPGSRGDTLLAGLRAQGTHASEPLDLVMKGVAVQALQPRHGPIVLDCALKYLRERGEDPGQSLASRGYLVSVCEYVYPEAWEAQVRQLMRVLDIAFDGRLTRSDIDRVFDQSGYRPTAALEQAVVRKTDRRNHEHVRNKVTQAIRRANGFPVHAVHFSQGRNSVARLLPWNWGRPGREPTAPPVNPGGLRNRAPSGDGVLPFPRTTAALVLVVLMILVVVIYLAVKLIVLHG